MITCARWDERLEDYLAGRLTEEEAAALEAHAAGCDRCAELMEHRGRLPHTLPSDVAPPPDVRDRVLRAVAPTRPQPRRWFIPTVIAAGLVLAFALTRPPAKSGQRPPGAGSPAALAAERATLQLEQLDAAREEIRAALAAAPQDRMLRDALARLDNQRRSIESLVREFES